MIFYAHKKEGPSGEIERQTVREHLQGTAALAEKFAQPFGAEKLARLAAMAHDLGKYTPGFQRRLLQGGPRVDHSTAGAYECMKLGNPYAAFCVLGHHAGIPDFGVRGDMSGSSTFWGRLNQATKLESYNVFQQDVALEKVDPPAFAEETPCSTFFFIRMLYSCLVDADFLDTEGFMEGPRPSQEYSLEALDRLLDQYTEKWFPPKGKLNQKRCEILNACKAAGTEKNSGLFSLTVPTGGGKTVSSLAFALKYAVKHHKKRIVYVIPYTSIIDQTAHTFSEILGEEYVLAHHSGVQYDTGEFGTQESIQKAKATENWDMPIVVSTAVEFFESLFSNRASKCRKLHNLAESVIIFDEAQMMPMPYLYPCVYAISELVKNYGVTAVLCTATQPALGSIFAQFLPGQEAVEICPRELAEHPIFTRVQYKWAGKITWEALCESMNQQNQVLCIVNSRKNAVRVFEGLRGNGIYHLSTLMCPAHRRQQLDEIRKRLKSGLPCKVVSTSMIEAGVDVDFPLVFREKAGLDSMIQAAGRCNREGKRSPEESIVILFESESSIPPLFSIPIGAAEMVMREFDEFVGSEAMQRYFQELMELKGRVALDQKQIMKRVERAAFPFRSIAEDFHLIETQTKTVYIPIDEGARLISELRKGSHTKTLYRRLGQYAVSVYPEHFSRLYAAGNISLLNEETGILQNLSLYSADTGLSLDADEGKALFI